MRITASAAVISLVVIASLTSGYSDPARGLDHASHERAIAETGAQMTCEQCHAQSRAGLLSGKPNHSWCFGKCHDSPAPPTGNKPYAVEASQRPLCEVCHSAASLSASSEKGSASLKGTPTFVAPDHQVTFSHLAHGKVSCADCHRFGTRRRPHSRCAGCHRRPTASASVAMTDCAGCHRAGATAVARTPFSVAEMFSHPRHAPRVAKGCVQCHSSARTATTLEIAAPTKADCIGCHDGKKAFSATAPKCRRCHSSPPILSKPVRSAGVPLTHRSHEAISCTNCHQPDGTFRASKGHALCASFECHSGELSSRQPRICSSCHVGSEPWLPQHVDLPRRRTSNFGVTFAHRKHAALADPRAKECRGCHLSGADSKDSGLGGNHASCSGATCHDQPTLTPGLSDCSGCHQAGRRVVRRQKAAARKWSVSTQFKHAVHAQDADGQLACTACHSLDQTPPDGRDLAPPPKKGCEPCHDGKAAFKLTGHACKRCHEK